MYDDYTSRQKQAYMMQALENSRRLNNILVRQVLKVIDEPLNSSFDYEKKLYSLNDAIYSLNNAAVITDPETKAKIKPLVTALDNCFRAERYIHSYLAKAMNYFREGEEISNQVGYVTARWVNDNQSFNLNTPHKAEIDRLIDKAWQYEAEVRTLMMLYGGKI